MPQLGFEPTISADERPQTYALHGAATGTETEKIYSSKILVSLYQITRHHFNIDRNLLFLHDNVKFPHLQLHKNLVCFTCISHTEYRIHMYLEARLQYYTFEHRLNF